MKESTTAGKESGNGSGDSPPAGKRFETFFTTIAKWKNDQIVEEYVMLDPRDIMNQVVAYDLPATAPVIRRPGQTRAWSNENSVAVKAAGRKNLIMVGVAVEVCQAY